ncbi:dehydrogenase/reductase SDR family protein 7-like [Phlebotomus argentipes]|uniref:dehydrogenase/reductase SDR family protein 7-like n=1 Tax=Phlebotomus argentipes TaxID=94469 RepID=UPI0028936BB5|nr:dehydrogenase/reductase SDR family protein 7-like [Phlebotomus argentipes]
MREGIVSERSFSVWKLLGWMCLPIPYFIYQIVLRMREQKARETLQGKVVLITGASSGLGESLAHVFYMAGCKVVLSARRKDELERVRKDLLECYSRTPTHPPVVVPLDLTDVNGLPEKVTGILNIFGKIDILVNNGGISVRSTALATTIDVDIKVMLVNYFGSVALTKAILPHMIKRQEGRIVFVSSVQGKFAIPQRSAYAASKHALQAFGDSLRAEVDDQGVRVTMISPGYINTALSVNALTGSGASYGKMDATTAAGANPDDMAGEILKCILRDDKDVILAPVTPRIAHLLRYFCPPLYFWIMARRALKLAAEN